MQVFEYAHRWQPDHYDMPSTEWMKIAMNEAIESRKWGEHPVGAVVVQGNTIISQSGNRTHRDTNPTHHAEVVAIGLAAKRLERKQLTDCILYTTHEPCPMCAAASVYARIRGIIFGTNIHDALRFVSQHPQVNWRSFNISSSTIINNGDHLDIFVIAGFMRQQCLSLFNLLLVEGSISNEKEIE